MARDAAGRCVLLGVTGSIAAYKACEIARRLLEAGHRVQVLMTRAATRFVTPLTFHALTGVPPVVDLFGETGTGPPCPAGSSGEAVPSGGAGHGVLHIEMAQTGSLLLVAPCTANVLGKLAWGIADDALTATAMACRAPWILAPAMNPRMYAAPAVQDNVRRLEQRGVHFVGPVEGPLASPEEAAEGPGRMAEPEAIVTEALRLLSANPAS
jgi:phosphopantothenoylcysteine decarboxylase/phosphopantothenate--cysteine ligase